ncbi:serine/threonine protein kinase [Streptomyces incarnatus]|uniref:non-specific serine/threonine protein kinase n=1 Tax=Streptomyces incarnatus TaxID=665007 RepID=A0ABN4GJR7_9ACTN|nr:serine/threonine-protein kinase [Streptomyces incarnatus]AKJ12044.1 serine/threonine protein kinase [Streptomyces incarnatus]
MGEVFAGRYELADPIGRGGVGAVWRAWDHRRRRYVAAKVLQQRDAHSLLRFVREQALRIDHPHVLAPASWAADDDKVLFTMDLVAGGSLVHLVGDYGPLPPAFVCTLLDQLLSGLAAVHAEGVIHRDIKPANVLLEATGTGRPRLRLSDFGIAMRLGEPRLTETNLVVGTPGYLAPEQMLGAEPDFPADLFAVGLVALYLLEGAKPDAKALVQYFLDNGTPDPPKGIPEPLWQVVATLLQPDPAARFRTATGARKALASAAELLPAPEPDDELIEIFDQLGPLPPGFGPEGPLRRASGVAVELVEDTDTSPVSGAGAAGSAGATGSAGVADGGVGGADPGADAGTGSLSDTGSFRLPPPQDPLGAVQDPQAPAQDPRAFGPYPPQTQQLRPCSHSSPPSQPPFHEPYMGPPDSGTRAQHDPQAAQAPHAPWASVPPPGAMAWQEGDASTASYTAQDAQVPAQNTQVPAQDAHVPAQDAQAPAPAQPVPGGPAPGRAARRARRARRPGPPARVAVPMLLLALACYAVGFWALTRV